MGKKKKREVYVCFDTCTLVDCAFSSRPDTPSDLLVTIFNKMEEHGIRLLAPEVIEAELGSVIERRKGLMDDEVAAIKRGIEESPSLGAGSKQLLSKSVDEARNAIKSNAENIERLIRGKIEDEAFCEQVIFGEQEICSAVRLALANARPSKAKHGEGLLQADCLIVSCISSFIEQHGDCEIILCSSNTKDFAQKVGDEWQLADSIKSCLGDVRYYVKPSDLLKNELNLSDEEEEEVEALDEEYDRVVASSSFADALEDQTAQFAAFLKAMKNYGLDDLHERDISFLIPLYKGFQNTSPQNPYSIFAQSLQYKTPDLSDFKASLYSHPSIAEAAESLREMTAGISLKDNPEFRAMFNSTQEGIAISSLMKDSVLSSVEDPSTGLAVPSNSLEQISSELGDVATKYDSESISEAGNKFSSKPHSGSSEDTDSTCASDESR